MIPMRDRTYTDLLTACDGYRFLVLDFSAESDDGPIDRCHLVGGLFIDI